MGFRYPQPDNEDQFEQFCLNYYRRLWNNESLLLYAKRGESQEGVDIFDPLGMEPIRAIQCKHHEPTRPLAPRDIRSEVAKAECSSLHFSRYVIATTAKKSKHAQNTIVTLNGRPSSTKKFDIEIHFWEDICERLSSFSVLVATSIVYGRHCLADTLAAFREEPIVLAVFRELTSHTDASIGANTDEIEELFALRDHDAVRRELAKLPDGDQLNSVPERERYRILRFRGKLAQEEGRFELASQLFLKAFECDSTNVQAKQNRVLAYALLDDQSTAHKLAGEYLDQGITTPQMISHFVSSASAIGAIDIRSATIAQHVTNDENLNTALSHKYLQFNEIDKAREAATRAIAISPNSPHAHFAAAIVAHHSAVTGDRTERKQHLLVAKDHYDKADREATEQKFGQIRPEILTKRAIVELLLGNLSGADQDYVTAIHLSPMPSLYAVPAINYFLSQGKYGTARELLEVVDTNTLEGQFLETVTEYYNSGDRRERHRYLVQMRRLADAKWKREVECRFFCLDWALELDDLPFARACFPDDLITDYPLQGNTALAWIAYEQNELPLAVKFAEKSLESDIRQAHPQELRTLARILTLLKMTESALPLLEWITVPGVLSADTKTLITCAQQLGRHDLLLRLCRELREAGQQDDQLRKLEVQLLSKYSPESACTLCHNCIECSSTPWYFAAYLNWLRVRLGRLEELDFEQHRLPNPSQLAPSESQIVTLPYVAQGDYLRALLFLHGQLRAHFDDVRAHSNYLEFFRRYGAKLATQEPSTVDVDCAVLLQPDKGAAWWVTVETDNPLPSRGEYPSDSELCVRLLKHKVGDRVELPGNLVQIQTTTIVAIQSKHVRAFQDALEHFRARFPEALFIQTLDLGTGDGFDPTPLLESLKQRRAHVDDCIRFYDTESCSIHLFATGVGLSEWDAMKALATHPRGAIKCARASVPDFERIASRGIKEASIVLDISAIATLSFTKAWDALDDTKAYFVSRLTCELLEQWVIRACEDCEGRRGFAAITEDDRFLFREYSPSDLEACRAELSNALQIVKDRCQIASSLSVAALVPSVRDSYERFFGMHSLEAISVAKENDSLLWSDDFMVGMVAKADFGVNSVWTQVALKCSMAHGLLSPDGFNVISAKLAAWNYVTTVWTPATIVSAGREAIWSVDDWPLSSCIKLFSRIVTTAIKARYALETIRLLTQSECGVIREGLIVEAILTQIADRRAVIRMLQSLPRAFAIDFISGDRIQAQLEYWLITHVA